MKYIPLDLQGAYPRYEIHTSVFAVHTQHMVSRDPPNIIQSCKQHTAYQSHMKTWTLDNIKYIQLHKKYLFDVPLKF